MPITITLPIHYLARINNQNGEIGNWQQKRVWLERKQHLSISHSSLEPYMALNNVDNEIVIAFSISGAEVKSSISECRRISFLVTT